jgi:hypothetical protein
MRLVWVRSVFRLTVSSRAISGPSSAVASSRSTSSSRSLSGSTSGCADGGPSGRVVVAYSSRRTYSRGTCSSLASRRSSDAEHRPAAQDRVGQVPHPASQLGLAPVPAHRRHGQLHEVRGPLVVAAGQGMPDGVGGITVVLEPGTGPPVQPPDVVRLLFEQVRAQHVGEQVVVAVPLPMVVERDEEQVGPLQRHQPRRAAGLTGDGVAQPTGEPVEDGGPQQEAAHVGGLAGQHLLGQVVHDEPVVAGEPGDRRAGVVAVLQ